MEDGIGAVVPADAVVRMVGFAEYLEDLTKPLVLADAMPRDGDHVALFSGVNVHGRVSHVVPPFGISSASRLRERMSSGQTRIR